MSNLLIRKRQSPLLPSLLIKIMCKNKICWITRTRQHRTHCCSPEFTPWETWASHVTSNKYKPRKEQQKHKLNFPDSNSCALCIRPQCSILGQCLETHLLDTPYSKGYWQWNAEHWHSHHTAQCGGQMWEITEAYCHAVFRRKASIKFYPTYDAACWGLPWRKRSCLTASWRDNICHIQDTWWCRSLGRLLYWKREQRRTASWWCRMRFCSSSEILLEHPTHK